MGQKGEGEEDDIWMMRVVDREEEGKGEMRMVEGRRGCRLIVCCWSSKWCTAETLI